MVERHGLHQYNVTVSKAFFVNIKHSHCHVTISPLCTHNEEAEVGQFQFSKRNGPDHSFRFALTKQLVGPIL